MLGIFRCFSVLLGKHYLFLFPSKTHKKFPSQLDKIGWFPSQLIKFISQPGIPRAFKSLDPKRPNVAVHQFISTQSNASFTICPILYRKMQTPLRGWGTKRKEFTSLMRNKQIMLAFYFQKICSQVQNYIMEIDLFLTFGLSRY